MENFKAYISKCGGLNKAALQLGVSYQAIQKWIKNGEIPPRRVKVISKKTNIPKSQLNSNF